MRVRALRTMYDNVAVHREGEEFDYSGPPRADLEPLDHPKAKAKADEDEDDDKHTTYSKKK